MISDGQLEDIAATRSKLLVRGATVRPTPVNLCDAGLIQLLQKTGSTS